MDNLSALSSSGKCTRYYLFAIFIIVSRKGYEEEGWQFWAWKDDSKLPAFSWILIQLKEGSFSKVSRQAAGSKETLWLLSHQATNCNSN